MEMNDYSLLLDTSYRGWQESHAAYIELARQVAAGAIVLRGNVDAARAEADHALSDFMLLGQHPM